MNVGWKICLNTELKATTFFFYSKTFDFETQFTRGKITIKNHLWPHKKNMWFVVRERLLKTCCKKLRNMVSLKGSTCIRAHTHNDQNWCREILVEYRFEFTYFGGILYRNYIFSMQLYIWCNRSAQRVVWVCVFYVIRKAIYILQL